MFTVNERTAEAICCVFDEGGELSGIVEFKRDFPVIRDHARARECARMINACKPPPADEQQAGIGASVSDTQLPDPGRPPPVRPPPMPDERDRDGPERDDPEEPPRHEPPLPPWRNK